jgi:hypothetical protein
MHMGAVLYRASNAVTIRASLADVIPSISANPMLTFDFTVTINEINGLRLAMCSPNVREK